MIASFILAILFLVMGILLLNGKGGCLIAGYNTMSKKEKEEYDKNKLFKVVGTLCIVCCIMLCMMGYLGHLVDTGVLEEKNMLIFAIIFILVIILSILIASMNINLKNK